MVTLATLATASKQEIFDQVARHLLTQMARSTTGTTCLYINPEGKRCAAGALLSDKELERVQELCINNTGFRSLLAEFDTDIPYPPVDIVDFVTALQDIHDGSAPEHWAEGLIYLAAFHELDAGVVQKYA